MWDKTLLLTKLHRPRVTRDQVARPRLIERLDQGLDGRLTLVCAAAGFGKTTLVSSWVEGLAADGRLPVMWLALDENDSDLALFVRYLIAALQTNFPGAGSETLELVKSAAQAPISAIAGTLSNEIEQLPGRFILVLDDYSAITGQAVHDFLSTLLLHWPEPLHLVLVARTTPPLPLSNLRAWGQVNEIRSRDLRFSAEDAAAYLQKTLPLTLSQPARALLEQQTEGWIAGLQLAVLSLRHSDDPEAFVASLAEADTGLADYLVDEVLLKQPPVIQNFLLQTSILQRFCAGLAQAVVGDGDPDLDVAGCMEWLERANLFIIPLDNQREWYRYHHLFRDLLKRRLLSGADPASIASLYKKAVDWLAGQGLNNEAIDYALQANDLDRAAVLIEQGLGEALNREDQHTLERWLRLLPADFIQSRPGLLVIKAWVFYFQTQIGTPNPYLRQVEALLEGERGADLPEEARRVLRVQIAGLRGLHAYHTNQMAQSEALFREALALVPQNWTYLHGRTLLYLGMTMQANGLGAVAEQLLLSQYAALADKPGSLELNILYTLGFNLLQSGQLKQSADYFETLLRKSSFSDAALLRSWGLFFLGMACYQMNDLPAARRHLAEIVQHRFVSHASAFHMALQGLALIDQLEHRTDQAWETIEQLSQLDYDRQGRETPMTQSTRARLWLLQGDLDSAGRWADDFQDPVPEEPLLWLEIPHLTRARVLLARHAAGDVPAALPILEALAGIAARTHNTRVMIEILALQALALDAQGKTSAAQAMLERAVKMASPGGSLRSFVDLGARMQTMLKELAWRGGSAPEIRRILAAFPPEQPANGSTKAAPDPVKTSAGENPALVEPLTAREYDILVLLRLRLSNKEIAEKLNISPLTVKRHTSNLFAKLGASQRQEAVAKAVALGLLPPA